MPQSQLTCMESPLARFSLLMKFDLACLIGLWIRSREMTAVAGGGVSRGASALVIRPRSEMLVAVADRGADRGADRAADRAADRGADRGINALMTPSSMKALLANLVMS